MGTVVDELTTKVAVEYYGITGCADVWEENLRFLTQQGTVNSDGTYGKGRQTPVLVWADGSTITMADARHKLEFKTQILFSDFLYFNAARVEAGLQREYKEGQKRELGTQRLWRVSGAGGFGLYKKWDADETQHVNKVINVFRAWSTKVPGVIASGEIKVQHTTARSS